MRNTGLEHIVNKANGQCTCSAHNNLFNRGPPLDIWARGGGAGVFTCELTCVY